MGRPRRPKKVLELTKTADKSEIDKRPDDLAPKIEKGSTIAPPASLKGEYAKAQWNAVVSQLIYTELVSVADLPTLEQAFIFLDKFNKTREIYEKLESTAEDITEYNVVVRLGNLTTALTKLSAAYNSIMYRFGITPVERAKVQFGEKKDDDNPIESLLSGNK